MGSWDPARYLAFGDERFRPSLDLIGALAVDPGTIWDLGCGTGDLTVLLADRWPAARVWGLDSSSEMLARARTDTRVAWVLGDIVTWEPDQSVDLIFSTAALHWVGDHERLFPRLVGLLAPGGVLAVQMPRNFDQPSHTLLAATAHAERWAERVGHLVGPVPVAEPVWYHRLLRPLVARLDIWETTYFHALTGPDPVAAWTRSTAARPFLDTLGADAEDFMADYAALLADAYPADPDGTTLFPFRRLFLLARK